MPGRVFAFGVNRRKPAVPPVEMRDVLHSLVEDLQIIALRRPQIVKWFADVARHCANDLERRKIQQPDDSEKPAV